MIKTRNALFLLWCILQGTAAFVPTPTLPSSPASFPPIKMTKYANVKESNCINNATWRRRLSLYLSSFLRSSGDKKKRRALASLFVALSFVFSQPVEARSSSKVEVVSCVKQRHISNGITHRRIPKCQSRRISSSPSIAVIPVNTRKEDFWTKRKLIMLAVGGGTILGLSLVPPVNDEDENDKKGTSSTSELQAPLPASITKEAFRELEELFAGNGRSDAPEISQPQQTLNYPPLIEEDVRVIFDPSAKKEEVEQPQTEEPTKETGIKAIKKVTPIIEDYNFLEDTLPFNREKVEMNVEEMINVVDQNINSGSAEQLPTVADAEASSKKEDATRKAILEAQLRQNMKKKKKEEVMDNKAKADIDIDTSTNTGDDTDTDIDANDGKEAENDNLGKDKSIHDTAGRNASTKKEESVRRAILEERLKTEAKALKVRKEEVSQRALLEEQLKQVTKSKQRQQEILEEKEDLFTIPISEKVDKKDKNVKTVIADTDSNKECVPEESTIEADDVASTIEEKPGYRRQPLSPDEEDRLQKKYSALPLKERAYRILVDLGMIDSSSD